jgi:hypothetical protein
MEEVSGPSGALTAGPARSLVAAGGSRKTAVAARRAHEDGSRWGAALGIAWCIAASKRCRQPRREDLDRQPRCSRGKCTYSSDFQTTGRAKVSRMRWTMARCQVNQQRYQTRCRNPS